MILSINIIQFAGWVGMKQKPIVIWNPEKYATIMGSDRQQKNSLQEENNNKGTALVSGEGDREAQK